MTTLCDDRNTTKLLLGEESAFTEDGCEEAGPHMLFSASFEEQEAILISSMGEGDVDIDDDDDLLLVRDNSTGSELFVPPPSLSGSDLCNKNMAYNVQGEDDDTATTHQMSQTLSYSLSSCSSFVIPGTAVVSPNLSFSRSSPSPNPEGSNLTRSSCPSSANTNAGELVTLSRQVTSDGSVDLDSLTPFVHSLSVSPKGCLSNRKKMSVYSPSAGVSSMAYHRRSKSTTDIIESSMIWLRSSMLAQDLDAGLKQLSPRAKSHNDNSCSQFNGDYDDALLERDEKNAPSSTGYSEFRGISERNKNTQDKTKASIFRCIDTLASSNTSNDDKDEILDPLLDSQHFRGDDPDLVSSELIPEVPWVVSCSFNDEEEEETGFGVEHDDSHYAEKPSALYDSYKKRRYFRRGSLSSLQEEQDQADSDAGLRHVLLDTGSSDSNINENHHETSPHLLHCELEHDVADIFENDLMINKRLYTERGSRAGSKEAQERSKTTNSGQNKHI